MSAIQRLGVTLPGVYLKTLRKAYEQFVRDQDIAALLALVNGLDVGITGPGSNDPSGTEKRAVLKREDLKLVCFEYVCH